jgi:hypothetical protein
MSVNKTRIEAGRKLHRKIWKSCGIEKAIRTYGFPAVKSALNAWINYQRENAKLLREKRELEKKLLEIEKKLFRKLFFSPTQIYFLDNSKK